MIIAEDQIRYLKFRIGAKFEGHNDSDENACILTLHGSIALFHNFDIKQLFALNFQ